MGGRDVVNSYYWDELQNFELSGLMKNPNIVSQAIVTLNLHELYARGYCGRCYASLPPVPTN